ncbi:MAG: carboxypeptidase regulatory-like domain-containing protein [Euryarchaeota archaeon]|nr:carboxypeptidase regulatory-like domain-containing protein [Euryarchaeota archaeon]
MKRVWAGIAALLLAGCLGAETKSADEPTAEPTTSSSDLGTLVVTVTTPEVVPVEGAEVVAEGPTPKSAFTDAKGAATLTDLEPGNYTVLAARAGYRPLQERGRLVDVLSGETVEVKLVLEPVEIVNASNAYHMTLPFNGFMGCSIAGAPGTIGYTTYCSRGLTVYGQGVRDPNDNSTHFWNIESRLIVGMVHEMKWQPTLPGTAGMLRIGTYRTYSCTGQAGVGQACTPAGAIAEHWGASPVSGTKLEGDGKNITKNYAKDAPFPQQVRTEVRAECSGSCSPFTFVFQQRYEAWVSSFYGLEPPAGWSVFPK